jgi:holo-[acyl-carrier protein] synthase
MAEHPAAYTRHAGGPELGAPVKVGVDLTSVGDVADSVARFGDRYVRRLFTVQEVESCGSPSRPESLAARFAAKEAALKVLEPSGARPPWRDIEVVRAPSGACRIRLHRQAAALAVERGIGPMSLSLSHEHGIAVAVVAAACTSPEALPRTPAQPIDSEQADQRGAHR